MLAIRDNQELMGIAPLALDGDTIRFAGNPSVCDYQDIVAGKGCEKKVISAVIDHLIQNKIRRMSLKTLRPDSATLVALKQVTAEKGFTLETTVDDVSYETPLPDNWDGYLEQLKGKQRHEVRRKIRKLESAGPVNFSLAGDDETLSKATEAFFDLFRRNRQDKAQFMTPSMQAYFKDLIRALGDHQMLRLYTLTVKSEPAASVLCFDYNGVRYLYNNGYDNRFNELSVGVLCKLFSIKTGIGMGCQGFDFLKGAQVYKKRIGGRKVELYQCDVILGQKKCEMR
ncbi:MAG: GNAT family N-acetyltransferase [Desulfobacteraceae bacterium]|nr:GNAT family N-acetyltransferase [Desulfobacteraceae bacterium]